MSPDEIRNIVRSMWLTSPEAELLGCIALALAEILHALTSRAVTADANGDRPWVSSGRADERSGMAPREADPQQLAE